MRGCSRVVLFPLLGDVTDCGPLNPGYERAP
jgi:hypothetical protein